MDRIFIQLSTKVTNVRLNTSFLSGVTTWINLRELDIMIHINTYDFTNLGKLDADQLQY